MTKIKICGLSRRCDIEAANQIKPDYVGFVFAPESRRFVSPDTAYNLKQFLFPGIQAVGVFVNATPETVAKMLNSGIIDIAQLHGGESEADIRYLKEKTGKPIWKAFQIGGKHSLAGAEKSSADLVLLDSGGGSGKTFDWAIIRDVTRPYILAGGLDAENVFSAVTMLHPYAVDVSSGVETNGMKDKIKMAAFAAAVRKEDE